MRSGTLKILAAVTTAALDVWVAAWYGPLLWQVYGPVPWARVALLITAGAIAFTLMDIWSRATVRIFRSIPTTAEEGADV